MHDVLAPGRAELDNLHPGRAAKIAEQLLRTLHTLHSKEVVLGAGLCPASLVQFRVGATPVFKAVELGSARLLGKHEQGAQRGARGGWAQGEGSACLQADCRS